MLPTDIENLFDEKPGTYAGERPVYDP
jgi:hypothetical protein